MSHCCSRTIPGLSDPTYLRNISGRRPSPSGRNGEVGELLAHLGGDPYVVRSSSTLEDGSDHAFTGKYESVFCTNQGKKDERIEELKAAVFRVYKSVWNESAVEYRRTRGLTHTDERMALLVQRVEGMRMGSYYLPLAAGMGCSYNPYKWMEQMNPEAGMLRIVLGLGTRAVERTPATIRD